MTATAIKRQKPELLQRAAQLQDQIAVIQEELDALLRKTTGPLRVTLPELHDPRSGRIDAQKLADYMAVPLKRLAEGLQLNYKAVHRHPAADSLQPALKPLKRALEILQGFFQKPETVRAWLNTPHPDLGGHTALDLILENDVPAVLRILENAEAGVPV